MLKIRSNLSFSCNTSPWMLGRRAHHKGCGFLEYQPVRWSLLWMRSCQWQPHFIYFWPFCITIVAFCEERYYDYDYDYYDEYIHSIIYCIDRFGIIRALPVFGFLYMIPSHICKQLLYTNERIRTNYVLAKYWDKNCESRKRLQSLK